ncbi:hypothetical protein [Micromonospora coriariae]|uniref:hypothetical protein n=1 Tax=Micromonospora coriariae TaxID=285665 RepID=UPI0038CBF58A
MFPSHRSPRLRLRLRLRLATLHAIDAVHRFVDVTTGDNQHLDTLGPLGMLLHPTTHTDPQRAVPVHRGVVNRPLPRFGASGPAAGTPSRR